MKSIAGLLENADLTWLLLAGLLFVISQWLSAERLQTLLHTTNFLISRKSNLQLYLIGMFYNFFIPGGIGGDAYKIYHLNKHFKWPIKKLTAGLLLDRGLGLSGILLIISILLSNDSHAISSTVVYSRVAIAILLICVLTHLIVKRFFNSFVSAFAKALSLAILVQLFQCLSVLCILKSLHVNEGFSTYLIVFLITSMLSFLSFSGIGIREFVFLQAATWFQFEASTGVAIGLIFTGITAFVSVFGGFLSLNIPRPRLTEIKRETCT